jgi:hypothetical protein
MLLDVRDARRRNDSVPVFVFQKPVGYNEILLPDVDFFGFGFYHSNAKIKDEIPYEDKSCSAVFVGSTTGGTINSEVVKNLSNPRLRAAAYFKNNPLVDFRLTKIVMCDTEETKRELEAAG